MQHLPNQSQGPHESGPPAPPAVNGFNSPPGFGGLRDLPQASLEPDAPGTVHSPFMADGIGAAEDALPAAHPTNPPECTTDPGIPLNPAEARPGSVRRSSGGRTGLDSHLQVIDDYTEAAAERPEKFEAVVATVNGSVAALTCRLQAAVIRVMDEPSCSIEDIEALAATMRTLNKCVSQFQQLSQLEHKMVVARRQRQDGGGPPVSWPGPPAWPR